MKRFVVILLVTLLCGTSAFAGWHHRRHHFDAGYYAADIAAGVIGTTAGVMLAREMMDDGHRHHTRPRIYVVEPEGECYTVISRKTGKIIQKCVEHASEKIIYID